MKKLILIAIVLFSTSIIAQEEKVYAYNTLDEVPKIVGCENVKDKIRCFNNLFATILDEYNFESNATGKVKFYYSFVIDSKGKIKDVRFNAPRTRISTLSMSLDGEEPAENGNQKIGLDGKRIKSGPDGNFRNALTHLLSDKITIIRPGKIGGKSVSTEYMSMFYLNL
jgi:hypothetical protein